jgi:hypothetical protein
MDTRLGFGHDLGSLGKTAHQYLTSQDFVV